ncbi:hypothetical protein L211DRAFT_894039, partial [Terfezia boudieri ATCC MYA-4762]
IAEGTVVLYTKRVMIALNIYWNEVTKWHTPEERKQMKKRLRDSGFELFKDCVGFLDGTTFPFKFKPYPDDRGVHFFNYRKKCYGLQAMIICDDVGRIVIFSSVYPASVHDGRCWLPVYANLQVRLRAIVPCHMMFV